MSLFPNYIYEYIFECITTYIYRPSIIQSKYFSFANNNNEVIKYCLVSKSIYEIISRLLSQESNFKNYHLLKNLIKNNNNNNNNSSYKLIKIKDSVQIFDTLKQYQIESAKENYDSSVYKKVLVKTGYNDSEIVLQSIEMFPSNVYFHLYISEQDIQVMEATLLKRGGEKIKNIKKIILYFLNNYTDQKEQLLNVVSELFEPCSLKFLDQIMYDSEGFSKIASSKNLKQLRFPLQPKFLSNVFNKESQLKQLYLWVYHHDIIMHSNGAQGEITDKCFLLKGNQDWPLLIEKLSNNRTLKRLKLMYRCFNCESASPCIKGMDTSILSQGFRTIFTSPFSSIQELQLNDDVIIDTDFIQGLVNNKTIKSITFSNQDFSFVITNILKYNKTIRNVALNFSDLSKDIKGLQLLQQEPYSSEIDLYSLSFSIDYLPETNIYINTIKSFNYQVKEFNLNLCLEYSLKSSPSKINYNIKGDTVCFKEQQLINNNNSILNIIKDESYDYK
ncbi:hypothetical protein DICPUDRAFT_76019 [Dictyostelium purpureum]|uniref:Uncharacterized protein n=1 Tax=Dictyostelium purpureum TaxID=5786 RepID=F0ZCC7_DICPU|nr:uncharacterized protein DICPUDRAFT_76019 [Dictyostelium purpureum]EGC38398.1 hypothetical protein DICPUDRAFT_76019 [Dictyostelium purpureum]|eukprot:XP_003285059.1 hypothetical protein DICPUDRAFT_76019 [Dictyostelium purpureum]